MFYILCCKIQSLKSKVLIRTYLRMLCNRPRHILRKYSFSYYILVSDRIVRRQTTATSDGVCFMRNRGWVRGWHQSPLNVPGRVNKRTHCKGRHALRLYHSWNSKGFPPFYNIQWVLRFFYAWHESAIFLNVKHFWEWVATLCHPTSLWVSLRLVDGWVKESTKFRDRILKIIYKIMH